MLRKVAIRALPNGLRAIQGLFGGSGDPEEDFRRIAKLQRQPLFELYDGKALGNDSFVVTEGQSFVARLT